MTSPHPEKKRQPIIPWILAVLLLVAILWGVFFMGDDDAVDPTDFPPPADAGAVMPADPAAGAPVDPTPLTDIVAIVAVTDPTPLIGRTVRLVNASVLSVPGDSIFWVGDSESQRLLVVLDETTRAGVGQDSLVNVNPGQRVSVSGTIRALPTDLTPWQARWNLPEDAMTTLRGQRFYVDADSASVVAR